MANSNLVPFSKFLRKREYLSFYWLPNFYSFSCFNCLSSFRSNCNDPHAREYLSPRLVASTGAFQNNSSSEHRRSSCILCSFECRVCHSSTWQLIRSTNECAHQARTLVFSCLKEAVTSWADFCARPSLLTNLSTYIVWLKLRCTAVASITV